MTWYKFLARGAVGPFSGRPWPSPQAIGHPGGWMAAARLEPCRSGLHLCRPTDLPLWLCEELYTVEVEGEVLVHDSFVLVHRARLVDRVDAWRRDTASAFSRDCALHVRDLAAEALRAAGRSKEADRLERCDTTDEIETVAGRIADGDDRVAPLVGFALDAARFATATRSGPRWAAGAATTAFVSATASRVSANGPAGRDGAEEERRRQGQWLASHLLVAH